MGVPLSRPFNKPAAPCDQMHHLAFLRVFNFNPYGRCLLCNSNFQGRISQTLWAHAVIFLLLWLCIAYVQKSHLQVTAYAVVIFNKGGTVRLKHEQKYQKTIYYFRSSIVFCRSIRFIIPM